MRFWRRARRADDVDATERAARDRAMLEEALAPYTDSPPETDVVDVRDDWSPRRPRHRRRPLRADS